jgi:para-nitrobenzyl esterase
MEAAIETKKPRGILWRVLLIITAVLFAAVLEFGRHTILGWVLTAALVALFALLRRKALAGRKRIVRFLCWILLFIAFGAILFVSWPPVKAVPAVEGRNGGETGVVHTLSGDVSGVYTKDKAVEVYAGIPYAKPPVGELRWREPQPADSWSGVLKADHFGPMSMQKVDLPIYSSLVRLIGYRELNISLRDNYRPPVSEDSLYLNVWKPAGEVSGLPVLVYIHGGSLQTGQTWYKDYSGAPLAREGVVVVNFAYRLGVFGFFADEELAAESPNGTTGNYGLLDQIAALKWVQDNIEAFGGDPNNVTVAGESAGAACVTALCTSPLAEGLFRRVVVESSTVTAPKPAHSFRLMDEALKTGEATRKRYRADSIEDLRAVPAEDIVSEAGRHHHITVDGYALTETPYESYAKGIHNEEAQLHGFNREEAAPFIMFGNAKLKNYEKKVREAFEEPYASEILALFPASTDAEAKRNWADIYSACIFTYGHYCLEREAKALGIPSYVYHFTKDNKALGTWHSGEMIYLYGNLPERSINYDGKDREVSSAMFYYLVNFVRTGDPNGSELPVWEPSDGGGRLMEFGETVGMADAPFLRLYEIFDRMSGFRAE